MVGDHLETLCARGGRPQVQPGEGQAGRAQVDMAVDESRRDETAVEIFDLGARKLAATDVIAAQPCDDVVAHRQGGGVGVG